MQKNFRSIFNENTDKFLYKKISDLYLMKIQISFYMQKNSDLYLMKIQISFYMQKNFKSVFNENTDLFYI